MHDQLTKCMEGLPELPDGFCFLLRSGPLELALSFFQFCSEHHFKLPTIH